MKQAREDLRLRLATLPASAGVYLARLEVGGKSFARKLVLVR